ncbi:hypothetical protein IJH46_03285 [Candidatus Saccharibacteria bacterium]|nr:hypothetical protein [Candidatus Saccharibacteria bacterium]
MFLITILLYAVAALTILTGISVLCGTTKQSKTKGVWFALAAMGTSVWSAAIAFFMSLPEANATLAPAVVVGIIAGITLTDIALLGYACWENARTGKIITLASALGGITLIVILALHPELFYNDITFGEELNTIHTVRTWYFYVIIAYFTVVSLIYTNSITKGTKHIKSHGAKLGLKIFQAGLSLGGILALVFDLLLLSSHPHLVWIGPMAVSVTITIFYYSVVKYRILALTGNSMRLLSYIILLAAGVIIYFVVFYTVFTAIFRIPSPSTQIILFNLIMVAIVLCLMPALSEVSSMIKALLPTKQFDVGYITKKLNNLNSGNVDIKELASFLATQLKFEYVGFLINGRLYGSKPFDVSSDDLVKIEKLKAPKFGVWQDFSKEETEEDEVTRVALLTDSKGKTVGQVLLGRPINRHILDRRDTIQIEMVFNLCSVIIDGDK